MECTTATIETTNINGRSAVSTMQYKYPLKFLHIANPAKVSPGRNNEAHTTAWIYEINYGGGLVSGDTIQIDLNVGENTTMVVTGQSSMKIYKSKEKGKHSKHHILGTVEKNALMCLAFPPVTCYAGSEYEQSQIIKLKDESASAVVVEWTTSGRIALGESWDFSFFQTCNEVWLGNELLIRDAVKLTDADGTPTVKERMFPYTSIATVIIVGSKVLPYATLAEEQVRKTQLEKPSANGVPAILSTASLLKKGLGTREKTVGSVIKIAGETPAQVLQFFQSFLAPLWSDLLGDDPYK